MAERELAIPAKLKNDAIVEALIELRFDMPTDSLPEIFFVHLAENPLWNEFEQRMMPAFHIPTQVRIGDANLRYQPCLELIAPDKGQIIRVGPQVLSYHRLAPYVGWKQFQLEIKDTVGWLFSQTREISIRRLGLRYVNALKADLHRIKSFLDLDLVLRVSGHLVSSNVNVNFTETINNDTACTVRIATPEFVQGTVPSNTVLFVDVDVFTKDDFSTRSQDAVVGWINDAHTAEKRSFFRLLTDLTINELKER